MDPVSSSLFHVSVGQRRVETGDPQRFLPLRPVDLILLLTLADGAQYGYALAREIAERTDGVVELGAGNLYRVIKRVRAHWT